MWRQLVLDGVLDGAYQLARLGIEVGRRAVVAEYRPVLGPDRHLTALPGTAADLDGRFEQRELVRPGREAAVAPEVVQFRQDGDEGVVGALLGQILLVTATQVGERARAAADLEASGLEQQLAQLAERFVALRPGGLQPPVERTRLRVRVGCCGRHWRAGDEADANTGELLQDWHRPRLATTTARFLPAGVPSGFFTRR